MKNERKTNHAFCCLRLAIFDFVRFSSQGPKSFTMRGLLALCWNVGPRWVNVFKKNIDFLLFCDFVAEIYKKNLEKRNKRDKIQEGLFWQNRLKHMDSGFNLACVQTPFPQKKSEKSLSPLEKCKFFDSSKMAFQ